MQTETENIQLRLGGLAGLDDEIDSLLGLWDTLQPTSVDAAQTPDPNLFAFIENALSFAVIMKKPPPPPPKDDEETDKNKPRPAVNSRWVDSLVRTRSPPPKRSTTPPLPKRGAVKQVGFDPIAPSLTQSPFSSNAAGERTKEDIIIDDQASHAPITLDVLQDLIQNVDSLSDSEKMAIIRSQTPQGHYPAPNPVRFKSEDEVINVDPYSDPFDADAADDELFSIPPEDPAPPWSAAPPSGSPKPVGFVYVIATPQPGEVNLGCVVAERYRGQGCAREAVNATLKWIFDTMKYRRAQVLILDSSEKADALRFFTQLGFGHEGIRRRAVFCPASGEWKDMIMLAMLDTEWLMRGYSTKRQVAPRSLWDEMFTRHEKEREALLRWEDDIEQKKRASLGLKRTMSMETIKVAEEIENVTQHEGDISDVEQGKKRRLSTSSHSSSSVSSTSRRFDSTTRLIPRSDSSASFYQSLTLPSLPSHQIQLDTDVVMPPDVDQWRTAVPSHFGSTSSSTAAPAPTTALSTALAAYAQAASRRASSQASRSSSGEQWDVMDAASEPDTVSVSGESSVSDFSTTGSSSGDSSFVDVDGEMWSFD